MVGIWRLIFFPSWRGINPPVSLPTNTWISFDVSTFISCLQRSHSSLPCKKIPRILLPRKVLLCAAGRAPGPGRDTEGSAAELGRNSSVKWLFVAGVKWSFVINWHLKDRVRNNGLGSDASSCRSLYPLLPPSGAMYPCQGESLTRAGVSTSQLASKTASGGS